MIIIEGPDNAGKSTLVRQLIEEDPKLRLLRRERFKPSKGDTIGGSYLGALIPEDGDRVSHGYSIADRLIASECIYGDLFRDGCRMSDAEHLAADLVLRSYQAVVVHCDVPDEHVLSSWTDREQLYDDPLTIAKSYRERIESIFPTRELFFRYDWTDPQADQMRDTIIKAHQGVMRHAHDQLSWWSVFSHGIGNLRSPKLVFIGEELSPSSTTQLPFAAGPAGDFLAWSLDQAGIDRRDIYVTNAMKGIAHDAPVLREELNHVIDPERTRVVMLGRVAQHVYEYLEDSLNVSPVAAVHIPHPQYWRRFKWNEREKYVEMLTRAVEARDEGDH